jgi:hypothetical protein
MTFPRRITARQRHVTGQMNKLEAKYASYLEQMKMLGEIVSWRFEAIKLKLAPSTFITPDFWVVMPDGSVEIREVKGHWEDDSRVKVKVAAEIFHEFIWVAVTDGKREGWKYEYFSKGEAA